MNIGFFNHKGGVGKTTSTINAAYELNCLGKSVLVVDCDEQKDSFYFFQKENDNEDSGIKSTVYDNISYTKWNDFSVTESYNYDYILFDFSPSNHAETVDMIKACDLIMIPIMLGEFEISGLNSVINTITEQNVDIKVFCTMVYPNEKDMFDEIKSELGNTLIRFPIPFSRTIRESQKENICIREYFVNKKIPYSKRVWKIVDAYRNLTEEIVKVGDLNG